MFVSASDHGDLPLQVKAAPSATHTNGACLWQGAGPTCTGGTGGQGGKGGKGGAPTQSPVTQYV